MNKFFSPGPRVRATAFSKLLRSRGDLVDPTVRSFYLEVLGATILSIAQMTFLLFTVFSSLRIVSYLPQIRKVALDNNGATAISYSTWSLWTCANIATALYASVNLQDLYLSIVSAVYAICCIVVILITLFKRRRSRVARAAARSRWMTAVSRRDAAAAEVRATVREAAAALAADRRPSHTFEQDLAAQARRMLWHDLTATAAYFAHRPSKRARVAQGRQSETVACVQHRRPTVMLVRAMGAALLAAAVLAFAASEAVAQCAPGSAPCPGGGCAPYGTVCCPDGQSYCPNNHVCVPAGGCARRDAMNRCSDGSFCYRDEICTREGGCLHVKDPRACPNRRQYCYQGEVCGGDNRCRSY